MRRGFTLVEALVATVAASIILVLLYGSLVFYSRAYTREDEVLERGRRGQEILGLFRDDAERAEGELQPQMLPVDGLKAIGWKSDPAALLLTPHRGTNVINCYTNLLAQKPYLSKRFQCFEVWTAMPGPQGVTVVRDADSSRYIGEQPPFLVKKHIPPVTASSAIAHIPVPYDNTKSDFVVIRKVVNNVAAVVLWAYHRDKVDSWPAGTLVRWTEQTGAKSIGGDQVASFTPDVFFDWSYADPAPPKRPDPHARVYKMQAGLSLEFGRSKVAGQEPGFEMHAVFLIGP